MMTDLLEYKVLRRIDSNNIILIRKQDIIIDNLESLLVNRNTVIKNKDIQLNIVKAKARRNNWIIGGSLGAAVVITLLSTLLTR